MHIYKLLVYALQFTQLHLEAFLAAYQDKVAGVHEDGYVSIDSVQYSAPWALDRIDQTDLPLDQLYHHYNTGSQVNVYIVDTVSLPQLLRYHCAVNCIIAAG